MVAEIVLCALSVDLIEDKSPHLLALAIEEKTSFQFQPFFSQNLINLSTFSFIFVIPPPANEDAWPDRRPPKG
ncbi:ras-related protein RABB1b [Gossypium australe]|uniref:Ras-related protein RABB1b n=1 Tax=Gossypium australe TaxID=47621 RepID=A0A5B6UP55_9ROSI|nr:ras-related protein RABB1b [Gossypium australe]